MASKPVLIAAVGLLTIVVITFSIFVISPGNQSQTQVSEQSIEACRDFEALEHPIGCREAVGIALGESPGTVEKVSIGNVDASVPSSSGGIEIRSVEMWLIDIRLANPYFDENFNKEVSLMQIGTPTEDHSVLHKKPLE